MTTPPTPPSPQRFGLRSQRLGCLPVVNFFLARLGLAEHLDAFLPHNDARLRLPPASVIRVVVANIAAGHLPVYALGDWAADYRHALGPTRRHRHPHPALPASQRPVGPDLDPTPQPDTRHRTGPLRNLILVTYKFVPHPWTTCLDPLSGRRGRLGP